MKCELELTAARPGAAAVVMMSVVEELRLMQAAPEGLINEMMANRNYVVSFVNAHAMNLACKDAQFLHALRSADLLLRDGVGMQILLKARGKEPGLNMNGTDFIPKVILANKQQPIALCGSTAATSRAAATWLEQNGVRRVFHCDGFQSPGYYVQLLRAQRPRIVILGMGMPKQELLSARLARELPGPVLILSGGAILDFMAHRFRRAPKLMRRLGLEWLFRLLLEPQRLWRRYLLGNCLFLWHTAQVLRMRYAAKI
ncbi:MAG TPA: WecB/TagA/CpsF family glycosyltransferase [Steroidobacteraceae bacterium]|nr:WecB/TagA/CpsF family glycosyltransferase [Steroidobacteraceae bacterium]